MPRLNLVDPKNAQGKAKELFDGPLKGMQLNIFKGMANSPAALEAYLNLSGALKGGLLSDTEREAIALAVGQDNGCEYCLAAHTFIGKQAGMSEDLTLEIRKGAVSDEKLAALTKFARALNEKRGGVSDADLKAMRDAGYNDGHIAETVANVALNVYTNYFNHVNDTDVDLPKAPAL